jgi:hypothetical protein
VKRADDENIFIVEMTLKVYQSLQKEGVKKVSVQGVIDMLDSTIKTMEMGKRK